MPQPEGREPKRQDLTICTNLSWLGELRAGVGVATPPRSRCRHAVRCRVRGLALKFREEMRNGELTEAGREVLWVAVNSYRYCTG